MTKVFDLKPRLMVFSEAGSGSNASPPWAQKGAEVLNDYCPGSFSLRNNITLEIKTCPQCGADVELFSIDKRVACDHCGFVVYGNAQSCIEWCRYAEQCFGAEMYVKLKNRQ